MLAITPYEEDHLFLTHVFQHTDWRIHRASSCTEGMRKTSVAAPSVIICERDLPDGCWRDVLEYISKLPESPLLIVTSRCADEYLWAEVLNLGGYDVLMKPFDRTEVLRVLSLAHRHWINIRERSLHPAVATPHAAALGM